METYNIRAVHTQISAMQFPSCCVAFFCKFNGKLNLPMEVLRVCWADINLKGQCNFLNVFQRPVNSFWKLSAGAVSSSYIQNNSVWKIYLTICGVNVFDAVSFIRYCFRALFTLINYGEMEN